MIFRRSLFIFFACALWAASVWRVGAQQRLSVENVRGAGGVNVRSDEGKYEGRTITAVEVGVEGAPPNADIERDLQRRLTIAPNTNFQAVRVRESLQALFDSGQVARARVEAYAVGANGVRVRFIVHLQLRVASVNLQLDNPAVTNASMGRNNAAVSTDEIRGRLTLIEPNARVTESALRANADAIQTYLRDRGYYRAEVTYTTTPDATGTRAAVNFRIRLNEQATVADFKISITNFDTTKIYPQLKLKRGAVFSRAALNADVDRIRQALIEENYLAPQLEGAETTIDDTGRLVTINLKGSKGPKVDVEVKGYDLREKRKRELLPIEREGNIDYSVIVEGARRLGNKLQEDGYFFAEVTPTCAVVPVDALPAVATKKNKNQATNQIVANTTEESCETLNPPDLNGKGVEIVYTVEPGRRFKLTDIRIEGTNKLTYDDVASSLRTREANALGFIPVLGYGRGYTNKDLLEQDRQTVQARMQDLGYRHAKVTARQGVSLDGESLIITFFVEEGTLTRVADIQYEGNKVFTVEKLNEQRCTPPPNTTYIVTNGTAGNMPLGDNNTNLVCNIKGAPYSRTLARTDRNRLIDFYSRNGYADTKVDLSIVDLPTPTATGDEQVNIIYKITEGKQVFINRIIVTGVERTKREAVLRAITLREGELLRPDRITESERILYATDAFSEVNIRPEAAVETAQGVKKQDLIIEVTERKPRVIDYGGGYSTDNGPLGIFDISDTNLRGTLKQGSIRTRFSSNRQLVRLEYFDPRFYRYGSTNDDRAIVKFAPLTLSLQYQRDSSVTRFFRSTLDRGNMGIVQRLDAKGNPIDQFGKPAGEPSVNRLTFSAETQRVIQERTRSILFLRYSYEDVRLFNIDSLLIQPILQPDRVVRLSRFGASFARDTRDRQLDASRGSFLSADYSVALQQLGGNISFSKFQTKYNRYQKLNFLSVGRRETVLAGSVQFGVADLFNPRDRNNNGVIDLTDRTLPISERFFSGGSTTLRGFGFEEAGPRAVINPLNLNPRGQFFDLKGKPITLLPFTVPIGGNALAIVNLEARIGVTKTLQIVPFYDGGNVFQSFKDIYKHTGRQVINVGTNGTGTMPFSLDAATVRSEFTHTVGLGLRIRTPFGPLAVDYAYLLNPPEFILQQPHAPDSLIRAKRSQIHFRFGQTF